MPNFNLSGEQSFRDGNRKSSDESSLKKNDPVNKSASDSSQQKITQAQPANLVPESTSEIDFTPRHPLEQLKKDAQSIDSSLPEKKSPAYTEIPNLFPVEIPFVRIEELREKREKKLDKPPVTIPTTEIKTEKKKSEQQAVVQSVQPESVVIPNSSFSSQQIDLIKTNDADANSLHEKLPPLEFVPEKKHHSFLKYILLVLIFLCAAVMIYYLGLIPGYTRYVDHVLGKTSGIPSNQIKESVMNQGAHPAQSTLQVLNYNYFIQVSSWEQQYLAEKEKEKFLNKNISARVETEFIAKKKRTHYRVRIGPFQSKAEAQKIKIKYAGMIPRDAFIDSTLSYDKNSAAEKKSIAPIKSDTKKETLSPNEHPLKKSTSKSPTQKTAQQQPVLKIKHGFVVAVSSFKQKSLADQEAKSLLAKGYSAFVQQTPSASSNWYRVQVGPFTSQDQAKKYLQLIRATFGNDAYIIDLSLE